MRDELIKGSKCISKYAGEYSIGKFPQQCEIRGIVKQVIAGNDIKRANRIVDSCYYLEVDFYRVGEMNYKAIVGTAKIYIPTSAMGLRDFSQSVFYYPSTNVDDKKTLFQTGMTNLNTLFNKRVGIVGMMKDEAHEQFTHFMNKVKKIVVFLSPEELQRGRK